MTASIHASYDLALHGAISIQVTDNGGTFTVSDSAGRYCAVNLSTVDSSITAAGTNLQTLLNAGTSIGGNPYTVSFSTSTCKYTIATADANNFSLTFNTTISRQYFGFSGNKSGARTYTSDNRAHYSLLTTAGARSGYTNDYEPTGFAMDAYTEGGSHLGIAATAFPVWSDFVFTVEPIAQVYSASAVSTAPWTYQHLVQHARNIYPFVVVDDTESTVHRLRADSASFRPTRMIADSDALWTVPFQTVRLGRL